MAEFERPIARPGCEELDLRPAGGDSAPSDRYGLTTQSSACVPLNMLDFIKQSQTEEPSACDQLFQQLDKTHGLGLCEAAASMKFDGVGLGPSPMSVLGSKIIPKGWALLQGGLSKSKAAPATPAGKTRVPRATHGSKGKLDELMLGGKAAEMEVFGLATSGGAPDLLAALQSAGSKAGIIRHAGGEYVVVVKWAKEGGTVHVFSRNGTVPMGSQGLSPEVTMEELVDAVITVARDYSLR